MDACTDRFSLNVFICAHYRCRPSCAFVSVHAATLITKAALLKPFFIFTGFCLRAMTPAKIRLVSAAMGKKGTNIANLSEEIGISRATLYRHVSATGEIRAAGQKILK